MYYIYLITYRLSNAVYTAEMALQSDMYAYTRDAIRDAIDDCISPQAVVLGIEFLRTEDH